MNDERKKKIKDLVEAFKSNLTYEDVLEAEAMAEGYVEGLKDGMNMSKWIPCEERLPSETKDYLCWVINPHDTELQYYMICTYYAGAERWYPIDETASDNVVAWMPLPEPYMEGADDE